MRVAVVGTGNVGSGLLYFLAASPHVDEVLVMSRRWSKSRAAVMDVASARPHGALKLVPSPYAHMFRADVVVITAGATPEAVPDRQELLAVNRTIVGDILDQSEWAPSTKLIVLATPVDDITAFAQRRTGLPHARVMGFGGDLDRNRLASVLLALGQQAENIHVVGEHGRKAIPVYPGEDQYDQVASQVRRYLATIIELAGPPRNLATSVLLGALVSTIATDAHKMHHVCGYHPKFGVHLTWPFNVGRTGLIGPDVLYPGTCAQADLNALVEERRRKESLLEGSSTGAG